MVSRIENGAESVLSAWIAMEVLSPPGFQEPQDFVAGDGSAVMALNDRALPWELDAVLSRSNARTYYQLMLGSLNLEAAMRRLVSVYKDAPIEPGRPLAARALLAVAVLDYRGIPVKGNTAAVSSFAWGLPRALAGDQLGTLDTWPDVERKLNEGLAEQLRRADSAGEPLPLTAGRIREAFDWLVSALGLPRELVEAPRYALRSFEPASQPHPPGPLLLNSFLLKHLVLAADAFRTGCASANLRLYLGSLKPSQRRDLLNDQASLEEAVRPGLFSPGRWPGPGRRPLVLLQQAAVNLALEDLKDFGILAVNGPPGTGKTTLLRDIVAGLVTERARVLATFDDPAAAFTDSGQRIQAGNGHFTLHHLDPRLRGFEILVASSSNKAVENISAELPGTAAVADDAPGLRYFKTTSDALQVARRSTWGMIAAVLGNSANRNHFKKVFWWDKDVGFSSYLQAAAGGRQMIKCIDPDTGVIRERLPRVVTSESAPCGRDEALRRWRAARVAFQDALRQSEQLLQQIEALHAFHEVERAMTRASHSAEQAQTEFRQHMAACPPWWSGLLFTPRSRAWRRESGSKARNASTTASAVAETLARADELRAAIGGPVESLRTRLGSRLVDDRFFLRQRRDYQLEAPWLDDGIHRARDSVFVAAMALHKAFIDVAAKPLRHNLGALMSVFGGRPGASSLPDAVHAELWATLFLVVPVVSTTFASVDRMLGRLPSESLGWLLIDEAGQASPQAAVGALMKTRRAVVVGDPMQIEPVVTLPASLTETICRHFGIEPERFNAPGASIQTLANEATSCMAAFEGQHGHRTVGVPLLIHRRCAEPMFGLSNALAYDRSMISARTGAPSAIRASLGPSHWFDVEGECWDKWCHREGECVIGLLRQLAAGRIEPDAYIVTPFVVVQDRLRDAILASGVLEGWVTEPRDWVRQRVGTVHIVQGREAEAVIFVLGAQGPKHSAARSWAGGRPNLLNVAVSRAKEVLYVIGSRRLWREAGIFSELDAQMP